MTPSLPSLTSTPSRVQPQAEDAPARAAATTGRGSRRTRDAGSSTAVVWLELDERFLCQMNAPGGLTDASGHPYDNAASWMKEKLQKQCTARKEEVAAWAAAEARATAASISAGETATEEHSAGLAVPKSTAATLTPDEEGHLAQSGARPRRCTWSA